MRTAWLSVALTLAATGCDKPPVMEIRHSRVASSPPRPVRLDATTRDRFPSPFAVGPGHGARGLGDTGAPPAADAFAFEAPDGWSRVAPTAMRMLNLEVPGGAECYVAHLPGAAGGTLQNVNRWRKQLTLEPIDGEALAKLPNRQVLGRTAVSVVLVGGGAKAKDGITGVILPHILRGVAGTLFVKMVGPAAILASERDHFDAFCASLEAKAGASGPADPDDADHAPPTPAGPPVPPRLRWTAPAGWTEAPAKPMREVTYQAGAPDLECYVSVLSGLAGGVTNNVNRWRKQLGQGPLDDEGVVALPTTPMLERDARVVEVSGAYTGMDEVHHEGWTLLGAICELDGAMVFVKMLGPTAKVAAARESFRAFCASVEVNK